MFPITPFPPLNIRFPFIISRVKHCRKMFKPLTLVSLLPTFCFLPDPIHVFTSFQKCFGSSMLSARDWAFFLLKDCFHSVAFGMHISIKRTFACLLQVAFVCIYVISLCTAFFEWSNLGQTILLIFSSHQLLFSWPYTYLPFLDTPRIHQELHWCPQTRRR